MGVLSVDGGFPRQVVQGYLIDSLLS